MCQHDSVHIITHVERRLDEITNNFSLLLHVVALCNVCGQPFQLNKDHVNTELWADVTNKETQQLWRLPATTVGMIEASTANDQFKEPELPVSEALSQ